MVRIPGSEVYRVKSEVSLQRLVEARGIDLRRHGASRQLGRQVGSLDARSTGSER